jgi:hypothetical protein
VTTVSDLTTGDGNRQARRALVELIRHNRALLFAGAGFAVPAGFPSWTGLLSELEELCDASGPGFARDAVAIDQDPLRYADAIKAHIEHATGNLERYYAHLARRFSARPSLDRFHHDIVALPFRGFITSNYEPTLEAALAFAEPEPVDKFVIVPRTPGGFVREFHQSLTGTGARLVAHIHGYYRQPETIVLSASDYAIAYGLNSTDADRPMLVAFLEAVLAPWSLVFLGFGFRDQLFEEFLRSASRRYNLWNTDSHFALVGTTRDTADLDSHRARQFKATYGIETVFYEQIGGSHQPLYDMIAEIREELGLLPRPGLVDINDRMIEGMRG